MFCQKGLFYGHPKIAGLATIQVSLPLEPEQIETFLSKAFKKKKMLFNLKVNICLETDKSKPINIIYEGEDHATFNPCIVLLIIIKELKLIQKITVLILVEAIDGIHIGERKRINFYPLLSISRVAKEHHAD